MKSRDLLSDLPLSPPSVLEKLSASTIAEKWERCKIVGRILRHEKKIDEAGNPCLIDFTAVPPYRANLVATM
jgi:hypothetical protein